jgi:CHAD domain-containing protein
MRCRHRVRSAIFAQPKLYSPGIRVSLVAISSVTLTRNAQGLSVMKCLDQYRRKLLTGVNQNLRVIVDTVDEESIHQFRVGVKRLTALYRFVAAVEPGLQAKQLLKPARRLSMSISTIRDCHITLGLIGATGRLTAAEIKTLQRAVHTRIRGNHREFCKLAQEGVRIPLRLPTIRSLQITQDKLLQQKPVVLQQLLARVSTPVRSNTDEQWHRKRILLKRYRHTHEAFNLCPGYRRDENELKLIGLLEQLLGDWHDRVIARDILRACCELEPPTAPLIAELARQEKLLLGAARIYLDKFFHEKSLLC